MLEPSEVERTAGTLRGAIDSAFACRIGLARANELLAIDAAVARHCALAAGDPGADFTPLLAPYRLDSLH